MSKSTRAINETAGKLPAAAKDDAGEAEATPHQHHSVLREYFESAVVTVIMALFFMTFVAQAATVPSASMENTIYVGDHFLINKFIFAPGPHVPFLPQRDVRRGDVVVFRYPAESIPRDQIFQYKTYFIKRVIGLPGETIEVQGSRVFVDGKELPEHSIAYHDPRRGDDKAELKSLTAPPKSDDSLYSVYYSSLVTDDDRQTYLSVGMSYGVHEPYKLKPDEYFMMGDNRDNSKDSRFWGPVKRDLVVGRAMFVIWSYDESKPKDDTLLIGPVINLFNNTRWGRTGTLIR
ncbi:MAG TPA: signal peptidase I [Pyrinomonadaceae bacterium]